MWLLVDEYTHPGIEAAVSTIREKSEEVFDTIVTGSIGMSQIIDKEHLSKWVWNLPLFSPQGNVLPRSLSSKLLRTGLYGRDAPSGAIFVILLQELLSSQQPSVENDQKLSVDNDLEMIRGFRTYAGKHSDALMKMEVILHLQLPVCTPLHAVLVSLESGAWIPSTCTCTLPSCPEEMNLLEYSEKGVECIKQQTKSDRSGVSLPYAFPVFDYLLVHRTQQGLVSHTHHSFR